MLENTERECGTGCELMGWGLNCGPTCGLTVETITEAPLLFVERPVTSRIVI